MSETERDSPDPLDARALRLAFYGGEPGGTVSWVGLERVRNYVLAHAPRPECVDVEAALVLADTIAIAAMARSPALDAYRDELRALLTNHTAAHAPAPERVDVEAVMRLVVQIVSLRIQGVTTSTSDRELRALLTNRTVAHAPAPECVDVEAIERRTVAYGDARVKEALDDSLYTRATFSVGHLRELRALLTNKTAAPRLAPESFCLENVNKDMLSELATVRAEDNTSRAILGLVVAADYIDWGSGETFGTLKNPKHADHAAVRAMVEVKKKLAEETKRADAAERLRAVDVEELRRAKDRGRAEGIAAERRRHDKITCERFCTNCEKSIVSRRGDTCNQCSGAMGQPRECLDTMPAAIAAPEQVRQTSEGPAALHDARVKLEGENFCLENVNRDLRAECERLRGELVEQKEYSRKLETKLADEAKRADAAEKERDDAYTRGYSDGLSLGQRQGRAEGIAVERARGDAWEARFRSAVRIAKGHYVTWQQLDGIELANPLPVVTAAPEQASQDKRDTSHPLDVVTLLRVYRRAAAKNDESDGDDIEAGVFAVRDHIIAHAPRPEDVEALVELAARWLGEAGHKEAAEGLRRRDRTDDPGGWVKAASEGRVTVTFDPLGPPRTVGKEAKQAPDDFSIRFTGTALEAFRRENALSMKSQQELEKEVDRLHYVLRTVLSPWAYRQVAEAKLPEKEGQS